MHGLGVDCGIDLPTLVQTAWFAAGLLGRAPTSKVAQAMGLSH